MLTIKNIDKIKGCEFQYRGDKWLVYGIEEQAHQYLIVFMPQDIQTQIWVISKAVTVHLSRLRRNPIRGKHIRYVLHSGLVTSDIEWIDIETPNDLIKRICDEQLISSNVSWVKMHQQQILLSSRQP